VSAFWVLLGFAAIIVALNLEAIVEAWRGGNDEK